MPHESHQKMFSRVSNLVAKRGLMKGEQIVVEGSTMEANATL